MSRTYIVLILGLVLVSAACAEDLATVSTSASASETLKPTRASFDVSIVNSARSTATVRTDNAKTTAAVKAALLAAGFPEKDLMSSSLTVGIHWIYPGNGSAKADGFDATNRLHVETGALDAVGIYLDAALGGGAREVSAVSFSADELDAARHRALARAVAIAEADARAMCGAAHARLGQLLSLSTSPLRNDNAEPMTDIVVTGSLARTMSAPPAPATSVIVPDITISASAYGRWRLIPESR